MSLVPPYLTIPLMDDVLIPYHDQVKEIRSRTADQPQQQAVELAELRERDGRRRLVTVFWYLSGLAGAAVGPGLRLGQGSRHGMGQRTDRRQFAQRNLCAPAAPLVGLLFQKRTGDLIARISSDTDRINNYLSDTVVDFGADVLMIVGTAVILVSIDPLLAIVTLVPLPLTIWLVYLVRSRLPTGIRARRTALGEMTSVLADSIPGIRVVRAFAQARRRTCASATPTTASWKPTTASTRPGLSSGRWWLC